MRPTLLHMFCSLVLLVGGLVIVGYWLQSPALVQVIPGAVPMAFNTALGFVLLAGAFLLRLDCRRREARWLALAALPLPTLTLYQYATGTSLGIDTLFTTNFIIVETAHPGRMAPQTAVSFILTIVGLFSLTSKKGWRLKYLSACWCGMIITLLGLLALLGYLFNVQSLYGWGYFPRMAVHTAIAFTLLGVVLIGSAFRTDQTRIDSVPNIRARLLTYSLSGALFIALFSANAALLPSFAYLESAARQSLEINALHKRSIIEEWVKGLGETLAQMSSRTEVEKGFEEYLRGGLPLSVLRTKVLGDIQDALSASTSVLGMCRVQREECLFGAGIQLSREQIERASHHDGFLHGPSRDKGHTIFIAKQQHLTGNHRTLIQDLYAVDADGLIDALRLNTDKREEVFLAISEGVKRTAIFKLDPERAQLMPSEGDAPIQIAREKNKNKASGTYQTDVSVKKGAIIGFASVPSLDWTVFTKADPNTIYEGVSAWLMTAMALVGVVIVLGSIGMVLLLQPLQRQMFFHASTLEERIDEKTKELQKIARYKSQFLANMSHEIRTPLTVILGFGEQLQDPEIPANVASESVQAIIRNGKHLLTIVNDVLDFSKIEAGRLELERIEFSPLEVVKDVLNLMEPRSSEKELTLSFEPSLPLPETIVSDPTRLRQVILNLLSNAIKFTQKGGIKVGLGYKAAEHVVIIRVEDSGIGLTESQRLRLFSPFNQADSSTTRQFGGTGLGLAISHQLITLLGGSMEVESMPGVGTRFTVQLPIGEIAPKLIERLPEPTAPASPTKITPPKLSGSILLAEDSDDIRAMVLYLVKKTGANIEFAPNGQIAVQMAKEKRFDLILMDMQMPIMDGYTATALLRAQGYTGPVVGLTANTVGGGLHRCIEAGCNESMGKPFKADAFYRLLESYITAEGRGTQGDYAVPDALLASFTSRLPEKIMQIERLFSAREWDALKSDAHKLAGSAGLYGFTDLSDIASLLENGAKKQDEEEVSRCLQEMHRRLQEIVPH